MTVSHVWLFRRNTAAWHSSLLSHALLGTIQSEVSTTLKLSPRLSFIHIHLQVYNYFIGTVAFTFHKTAAMVGLETNPTLAATRNETGRNNY